MDEQFSDLHEIGIGGGGTKKKINMVVATDVLGLKTKVSRWLSFHPFTRAPAHTLLTLVIAEENIIKPLHNNSTQHKVLIRFCVGLGESERQQQQKNTPYEFQISSLVQFLNSWRFFFMSWSVAD